MQEVHGGSLDSGFFDDDEVCDASILRTALAHGPRGPHTWTLAHVLPRRPHTRTRSTLAVQAHSLLTTLGHRCAHPFWQVLSNVGSGSEEEIGPLKEKGKKGAQKGKKPGARGKTAAKKAKPTAGAKRKAPAAGGAAKRQKT